MSAFLGILSLRQHKHKWKKERTNTNTVKKNDLNEFPLTTKVIFYVHRLTNTMRNKRSCCDCEFFLYRMTYMSSVFFSFLKTGEAKRKFLAVIYFSEKKDRRKEAKNNKNDENGEKKITHVYLFFSSSVSCLVLNVSFFLCVHIKCMYEMVSSLTTKYHYWQEKWRWK